jgi:hypothetical protein
MANVKQISRKDNNRLKTLENRYDRLLEANNTFHYTQSGNPRTAKYFKVLLRVKEQIAIERMVGRAINLKATSRVRQGFLNPQNGLTMQDLRNLTSPSL